MKTVLSKTYSVLLTSLFFGTILVGCTRSGNYQAQLNELEKRYGELETKYAKMKLIQEKDQKTLADMEARKSELMLQIESLKEATHEMKKQLVSRTTERDVLVIQLSQFSKDLQDFAGKVESTVQKVIPKDQKK